MKQAEREAVRRRKERSVAERIAERAAAGVMPVLRLAFDPKAKPDMSLAESATPGDAVCVPPPGPRVDPPGLWIAVTDSAVTNGREPVVEDSAARNRRLEDVQRLAYRRRRPGSAGFDARERVF